MSVCVLLLMLANPSGVAAPIDLSMLREKYILPPDPMPLGQEWGSQQHRESVMALANGREAELGGNMQFAFRAYREAVNLDHCNESAWQGLIRIGQHAGDASLLREAWNRRLVLCPEDPRALAFGAASAIRAGRDREALSLMLRRDAVDPPDSEIEDARWDAALGVQCERVGEHSVAEQLNSSAAARLRSHALEDPGDRLHRRVWNAVIQQLVAEGSPSLARTIAAERLLGGQLSNRGDRGRFASACIAIDALLADADATAELIRALPANDLRLRMEFRTPLEPAEMWTHASTVHATLGNVHGAIMLLEEAIKYDDRYGLALNNLGYMLLEQGQDPERAEGLIEAAWRADAESPANLDSLGWLRVKQGKLEDDPSWGRGALSLLREAARRSDQMDPVIIEHLGDAEFAAGEMDSARRTWRHALALVTDPRFEADRVRQCELIQTGDWGIRVISSREMYDLEFGQSADRLRAKLADGTPDEAEN